MRAYRLLSAKKHIVSHDVHEISNYLAHLDNITVFESINTSNPNKGGAAIISLDKSLNLRLISKDS